MLCSVVTAGITFINMFFISRCSHRRSLSTVSVFISYLSIISQKLLIPLDMGG
jgi:hypothetical protein